MTNLTLQGLNDIIDKFRNGVNVPIRLLSTNDTVYDIGPRIIVQPYKHAKIALSYDCTVSDEFRDEFNAWLLDEFGFEYKETLKDGQILSNEIGLLMNAYTESILTQALKGQV